MTPFRLRHLHAAAAHARTDELLRRADLYRARHDAAAGTPRRAWRNDGDDRRPRLGK